MTRLEVFLGSKGFSSCIDYSEREMVIADFSMSSMMLCMSFAPCFKSYLLTLLSLSWESWLIVSTVLTFGLCSYFL